MKIELVGGPCDGETREVQDGAREFYVARPTSRLSLSVVTPTTEVQYTKGVYRYSGYQSTDTGAEQFSWRGWGA